MASSVETQRQRLSADDLKRCIREIKQVFGINTLSTSQFNGLLNFLNGRDSFVSLPTGSGKSLIFQMAPMVEMWFAETDSRSYWRKEAIIIIICPLIALMQDQIGRLTSIGLKAAYIGRDQAEDVLLGIEKGDYTFVFASPESSLCNTRWREMLTSKVYKERLVGIAVDEAHCITHWGLTSSNKKNSVFRIWYSKLNELRSLVTEGTPFLAWTATATRQTRDQIIEMLEMKSPIEIVESPNRTNVTFVVQKIDNSKHMVEYFRYLVEEIKSKSVNARRTIIYCQTIKQCSIIYNILKIELGDFIYHRSKDPRYRMVEILHSTTPESVKQHVMEMFSQSDSHLRILVATIAYGMGVNCKNVTRVIHFGPSNTVEAYMQESGRCGREGQQSYAILLYNSITIRAANEAMKSYLRGSSCRRQSLLQHFEYGSNATLHTPNGHFCCDICREMCKCSDGHCDVQLAIPVGEKNNTPDKERKVTSSQKMLLMEKLKTMAKDIATKQKSLVSVISANALLEFGTDQVSQVLDHCHLLFSYNDVMRHVDIWRRRHAKMVLNIISCIFQDMEVMDDDSDNDDDDVVDSDHNEWEDVVRDDSFLSLINQSDWHMESLSVLYSSSPAAEEASYPSFLETVICNVNDT